MALSGEGTYLPVDFRDGGVVDGICASRHDHTPVLKDIAAAAVDVKPSLEKEFHILGHNLRGIIFKNSHGQQILDPVGCAEESPFCAVGGLTSMKTAECASY